MEQVIRIFLILIESNANALCDIYLSIYDSTVIPRETDK